MDEIQKSRKEAFEIELIELLKKHDVSLDLLSEQGVPILEFDFDNVFNPETMNLECGFFSANLMQFNL